MKALPYTRIGHECARIISTMSIKQTVTECIRDTILESVLLRARRRKVIGNVSQPNIVRWDPKYCLCVHEVKRGWRTKLFAAAAADPTSNGSI